MTVEAVTATVDAAAMTAKAVLSARKERNGLTRRRQPPCPAFDS
jgi:hypothetical protein